jgi:hypothetical protein
MGIQKLDNLVKVGQLKAEASSEAEFDAHIRSGIERLRDAGAAGLSVPSRFLLAYGAAYQFSLAALRRHGYRPVNRYVVFQCLPHTIGAVPGIWRVLADAHDVRNGFEYEAEEEVTDDLCEQVIRCAKELAALLRP